MGLIRFSTLARQDQGRLEEGDSVTVTYTGELGSEDPVPVAVSVEKTDAV